MAHETGIQLLIEEGWRRSNDLHRFISTNPISPVTTWPNRVMFLALLCYATQLAKFTDLNREDFNALCLNFYDNIHPEEGSKP